MDESPVDETPEQESTAEEPPVETSPPAEGSLTPDAVKTALCQVKDPEVGLNIVDLGLVYDIVVDEGEVHVKMTLTSPGCPAGPEIMQDADQTVRKLDGVTDVEIELVWEPFWSPERIDPRVRAFLS